MSEPEDARPTEPEEDRPRKRREDDDRPRGRRDDDDEDDRPRRRRRRDDDEDDDYDDRPRRRRRDGEDEFNPAGLIVPLGASPLSLAACYLGLLGCIPPLGLVALVCGVLAVRRRKTASTYGSVTSDVRAWIGIALGGFFSLLQLAALTLFVLTQSGILR